MTRCCVSSENIKAMNADAAAADDYDDYSSRFVVIVVGWAVKQREGDRDRMRGNFGVRVTPSIQGPLGLDVGRWGKVREWGVLSQEAAIILLRNAVMGAASLRC